MSPTRSPRPPSTRKRPSARHRAAALRNLEKAWEANRTHWEKTPARMANSRRTIQLAQAALRGRPRRLSPAQLAAVRANMAKARAALNARGRSPEHLSKLRETIKKARAARRPKDEDALELERIRKDSRVWERLREGGPEVEAILKRFRADWMASRGVFGDAFAQSPRRLART